MADYYAKFTNSMAAGVGKPMTAIMLIHPSIREHIHVMSTMVQLTATNGTKYIKKFPSPHEDYTNFVKVPDKHLFKLLDEALHVSNSKTLKSLSVDEWIAKCKERELHLLIRAGGTTPLFVRSTGLMASWRTLKREHAWEQRETKPGVTTVNPETVKKE